MFAGVIIYSIVNTKLSVDYQCYSKEGLNKLIDEKKYQTLIQTFTDDGKINETMFTPYYDKETIIVEYKKPNTEKYCIKSITHGTMVNEYSVEMLKNIKENEHEIHNSFITISSRM